MSFTKDRILESSISAFNQGFTIEGGDWHLQISSEQKFTLLNSENKILCPLESCVYDKPKKGNCVTVFRSMIDTLNLDFFYFMGFIRGFDHFEPARNNTSCFRVEDGENRSKGVEDGIWVRKELTSLGIVSEKSIIPYGEGYDNRFMKYVPKKD